MNLILGGWPSDWPHIPGSLNMNHPSGDTESIVAQDAPMKNAANWSIVRNITAESQLYLKILWKCSKYLEIVESIGFFRFLKVFPNRLCQHLRVRAGLSRRQHEVIAPNGRKDLSWKTACYAKVSMMQHAARSSCLGNDWCLTGNLEIDFARRSFACTLLTAKE